MKTSLHPLNQQPMSAANRATDKHRLIKEIGRLRLQLHQARFLDKAVERSEFLRGEIDDLSQQLSALRQSA